MAVPSAYAALSTLALAQEALYGTWGSGTITHPISLYDLVNGGQAGGSGNSYPVVNQDCLPNPASRTSNALTGVRGAMGGSAPRTLYYNSSIGAASNLVQGDQLYTDSSLTTAEGQTSNAQTGSSATTTICASSAQQVFFDTTVSGEYGGGTCVNI